MDGHGAAGTASDRGEGGRRGGRRREGVVPAGGTVVARGEAEGGGLGVEVDAEEVAHALPEVRVELAVPLQAGRSRPPT